jgi:hypothetical protein
MEWLNKIPDDAVIVRSACETSYIRASSKKKPNMLIRTENWFNPDLFQMKDDIRNLQEFGYIPIFWMKKETAEKNLSNLAFEMLK